MKNLFSALVALFVLFQISCRPQETPNIITVYEGQVSITPNNGANLSTLINDLKTIETINGDVYIKSYSNDFLSFLKNIKTINGNLEISETAIIDLGFLSSLETVNGTISLSINKSLKSTHGLENLKKTKGFALYGQYPLSQSIDLNPVQNLIVTDILNLQYLANDTLPFFKNITTLKNYLIIGSSNVKSLKCLSNLIAVDNNISIESNAKFQDLEGLNQLHSTGLLSIILNKELTSLKGLENLTKCNKFQILANQKLENFCGLKTYFNANNINEWIIYNNLQNPSIAEIKSKCK